MNRIILIGNGFDLAHGMPTSYRDFLDDFWKRKFEQVNDERKSDYSFSKQFENDFFIVSKIRPESIDVSSYHDVQRLSSSNEIELSFKNIFLQKISEKSYLQNWVDIENEYYELLKKAINEKADYSIKDLNRDFEQVKNLLKEYLKKVEYEFTTEKRNHSKYQIGEKVYSKLIWTDFSESAKNEKAEYEFQKVKTLREKNDSGEVLEVNLSIYEEINQPSDIKHLLLNESGTYDFGGFVGEVLLLNFNYTFTEKLYDSPFDFREFNFNPKKDDLANSIHIHGSLNENGSNPVIFGYGDELDDDYQRIEKLNKNEFLENIKSIKYLETANYKKLLEFIESDEYQVFIFGHSCGTSDRTLLNTLFEHDNCASIKPFYHKKEDGSDNYSDIVRNISRNFNSKVKFRDRVVNKTFCQPLVD